MDTEKYIAHSSANKLPFYSSWSLIKKAMGLKYIEQLMWSAQAQMIHLPHSAFTQGLENLVEETELWEEEKQEVYCEMVSSSHGRKATPMKSQQDVHLNKTWVIPVAVDTQTWMGKI